MCVMTVSELCTFRIGGCSRILSSRWCLILLARWRGHGHDRICSPSFYSKEDILRPYLRRHLKTFRGCYGCGTNVSDARSERAGPQTANLSILDGPYSYKVREGDTLTLIANKFKVSMQAIAILNDIADIDYVPAGKMLIIPRDCLNTGEVVPKVEHPLSSLDTQRCAGKGIVQTESVLSVTPASSFTLCSQTWHVRLALSLVLLLAMAVLVRRFIARLTTRRQDEQLHCQVQREIQEAHHQPKLRRWQGILDDDRRINEVDGNLLADSLTALDDEEESLRQTYAQLESAYVKFLADSGLTKSGYWRGGVPPALEEK